MVVIAFIGLGNMGLPMASNLIKGGHRILGVDLLPANQSAARAAGVEVMSSVAAAAAQADAVITMLPAGAHVRAVYVGEDGAMNHAKPGTLFIDSSTIDVETSRSLAALGDAKGFLMLDAPVSGGVGGAAAGTLTFMAGGTAEAFERASPLLGLMGKTIVHAGAAGAGQAAKICNNMILGISMIAVSEAFCLADHVGLDRRKLFEIAAQSSGQCWSLTSYCPVPDLVPTSPANRAYKAGFAADMMLKDLKLAQQAAHASGATTPLGAAAAALYQLFSASGRGDMDFSAIVKMLQGRDHGI
jgi:3-hydroxyisobutyrate dehydrogenase